MALNKIGPSHFLKNPNMKKNHNRRKFLSLGLLSGAGLLASQVNANPIAEAEKADTVMLLTPDGKLVEVNKSIVQQARTGTKVSNQEIREWTNLPKTKL